MKLKKKINKFNDGGKPKTKMGASSAAAAKKAFSGENLGGTLGAIGGTAMTLVDNAMKNAEVDTSAADNALEATKSFQTDNSSLDALANSYNSAPWANTDVNFKDFRPGAGELAMNTLSSFTSGMSAGATAGGAWGAIGGAAVGLGSALGGLFAGRAKAKKEEARLEAEAKLANQQLRAMGEASRDALMQQQANQNLMNVAAYGGPLNTFSGDFSNNITFINEGGTHEQNPFEGVLIGFDNEGTPNLVEEGEVIYGDYVFSNRLKANKKDLENIGFTDKYKDWTFAKIAEDLQKESAERPNDILSRKTLEDMMGRLTQVQEEVRMKKQQRKQNKFNLGGTIDVVEDPTEWQPAPLPYQSQLDNLYKNQINTIEVLNTFEKQRLANEYKKKYPKATDESIEKYVDKKFATKESQIKDKVHETYKGVSEIVESANKPIDTTIPDASDVVVENVDVPNFEIPSEINNFLQLFEEHANKLGVTKKRKDFNTDEEYDQYLEENAKRLSRASRKATREAYKTERDFDWTKFGNDTLRIGSPIAAGISALAQNLAKPDYSQNERALNEARTAPTSNIVAPTENISVRPIDVNYMANMLRNQGNTVISNIGNTAINAQQAMANQALANNQLQGQIADAYLKANDINLSRMLQENEFNRGNDQFRIQTAFQNFANNAARHNTIVGATAQAAAANSALDAARAQGILASESNLAESLAGVGSENHWSNIIKDAPWLLYDNQGRYKNPTDTLSSPITPTINRANGGRLLTKNKRRK